MAESGDTLTFSGSVISTLCQRWGVEVVRAGDVQPESAVLRQIAVMPDNLSPNIFYRLRAYVAQTETTSPYDLARWIAELGELMKLSKSTVTISGGSDSISMDEASLEGPISQPMDTDRNPSVVESLELVFISIKAPR